jgi:hypothetical protein
VPKDRARPPSRSSSKSLAPGRYKSRLTRDLSCFVSRPPFSGMPCDRLRQGNHTHEKKCPCEGFTYARSRPIWRRASRVRPNDRGAANRPLRYGGCHSGDAALSGQRRTKFPTIVLARSRWLSSPPTIPSFSLIASVSITPDIGSRTSSTSAKSPMNSAGTPGRRMLTLHKLSTDRAGIA